MSRPTIALAHIHNHNTERNARLLPSLTAFADSMAAEADVVRISIAHQPRPLAPLPALTSLRRDLANVRLGRLWARYREVPFSPVRTYRQALKRLMRLHILDRAGAGAHRRRVGAIEMILTDKHIRAWDQFLDGPADLLFVFEDDALFGDDSIALLHRARAIAEPLSQRPLYADLAGGAPFDRLGVDRLISQKEPPLLHFRRPVTNCTAAYLVNRAAAAAFQARILSRPHYRRISSDWLLNRLFMDLDAAGVAMSCFHFDPPALIHGSSVGGLGSTIR